VSHSDRLGRAELERIFPGDSEMAWRMRAFDWSTSDLGPAENWPEHLRVAVRLCLTSRSPILLWWGPKLAILYNDAVVACLTDAKHPRALGRPGREIWSEVWDTIGPMLESVVASGRATWSVDMEQFLDRKLRKEEVFMTFSFAPILAADGKTVDGIFCPCSESTGQVVGARRLETLRKLGVRAAEARTVEAACQQAAAVMGENTRDIPVAAIYVIGENCDEAMLCAATLPEGVHPFPGSVSASEDDLDSPWPLASVLRTKQSAECADLVEWGVRLPAGPWPEPTRHAFAFPLHAAENQLVGLLLVGVSPRRPLDDDYRVFFDLLTSHLVTAVGNAHAHEQEMRRSEALAERDRVKTAFFFNISHEFRAQLTLMLGLVDDLLEEFSGGPRSNTRELLVALRRNGLRLKKLVNTLLDFSRIEAGRVQAFYEPTDLATFTIDLANNFRSACAKAGLSLAIDCPPLDEPVFVDRDMWEKVVLNLLSNAFKFTLQGGLAVTLRVADGRAESSVRDTGTGIPPDGMPRLFERFHRVKETRGRTQEGSGIGLALVREFVRLHGGDVRAESELGQGSVFTVTVPLGKAHLPPDQVGAARVCESSALGAAYVEEALHWLPDQEGDGTEPRLSAPETIVTSRGTDVGDATVRARRRVLVVEDNADMREYIRALLATRHDVTAVSNGNAAREAARLEPPDLVLSDVMMPDMDGFELLRELRADPDTVAVPILMLSAAVGEEDRFFGLDGGADDYLTKPFSATELTSRVDAHLALARIRQQAGEALHESEERLRQLVVLMPAAVYSCDAEGRITFYNRRAVELWGREPDLNDRYCAAWRLWRIDGTLLPHEQTPVAKCIREGVSVRGMPIVIEQPKGVRVVVSLNIAPLVDRQGRRVGAINVFEDITEHKRDEEALRDSSARLQALSRRVIEVQEHERRHLARELHDEIGQVLSAISVNLHTIKGVCDAAASARIEESIHIVDQATQQVHNFSLDLRPSMLDHLGLAATVRWYADRQAQRVGFAVHFAVESSVARLPGDLEIACYRVVQETLTNVARHAHARHVWIELRQGDDELVLAIRDDGVGFEPDIARHRAARGESFGLLGIQERIELLGGRAVIRSQPGEGTTIRAWFPIASPPSAHSSSEVRQ
jgi:PAS domain S-box-containing protein